MFTEQQNALRTSIRAIWLPLTEHHLSAASHVQLVVYKFLLRTNCHCMTEHKRTYRFWVDLAKEDSEPLCCLHNCAIVASHTTLLLERVYLLRDSYLLVYGQLLERQRSFDR